jgi:hypothetical protein
MLDRVKLAQQLNQEINSLFQDNSAAYDIARRVWHEIVGDQEFARKASRTTLPWPVPSWTQELDRVYAQPTSVSTYTVISVDGSQIYPDRHQGVSCFLINIGAVTLRYGMPGKSVVFESKPFVFGAQSSDELGISPDMINSRRQELELQAALELHGKLKNAGESPVLLLDGSLIFWHLDTKNNELRDVFLPRYLAILHQLYVQRAAMASYISMPKSKELVNLIRLSLCNFDSSFQEKTRIVDCIVDANVAGFFLHPYERTIVFKNNSLISQSYPDHVAPYFFYLHVGHEIGRVEIPAWIAQEDSMIDRIAHVIIDQSIKGRGYPVAIAEAHEQAVVKGPDREFFYHLLYKIGIDHRRHVSISQKLLKKRNIGM